MTTGEGRSSTFAVNYLSTGERLQTNTSPSGTVQTRLFSPKSYLETATAPDGMVRERRGQKTGSSLAKTHCFAIIFLCQDLYALNYPVDCTTLPHAAIGARTSIFPIPTAKRGWLCLVKREKRGQF